MTTINIASSLNQSASVGFFKIKADKEKDNQSATHQTRTAKSTKKTEINSQGPSNSNQSTSRQLDPNAFGREIIKDIVSHPLQNKKFISVKEYLKNLDGKNYLKNNDILDLDKIESGEFAARSIKKNKKTAYIINIIFSYKEADHISDVIRSICKGLKQEDYSRIAIIFGVNAIRTKNEREKLNKALIHHQETISDLPFPVVIMGSLYGNKKTSYSEESFPYGKMRNAVLASEATREMTRYFVAQRFHPYVSFQDFDIGSRRVGNDAGEHIFHAIDRILAGKPKSTEKEDRAKKFEKLTLDEEQAKSKKKAKRKEEAAQDTAKEEGFMRPLMIAGGYRVDSKFMEMRINKYGPEKAKGVTPEMIEELSAAVKKNMKSRDVSAQKHPLLPYGTETNLFVDAIIGYKNRPLSTVSLLKIPVATEQSAEVRLSFGGKDAEYNGLAKQLHEYATEELESFYQKSLEQELRSLCDSFLNEIGLKNPRDEVKELLLEIFQKKCQLNAQKRLNNFNNKNYKKYLEKNDADKSKYLEMQAEFKKLQRQSRVRVENFHQISEVFDKYDEYLQILLEDLEISPTVLKISDKKLKEIEEINKQKEKNLEKHKNNLENFEKNIKIIRENLAGINNDLQTSCNSFINIIIYKSRFSELKIKEILKKFLKENERRAEIVLAKLLVDSQNNRHPTREQMFYTDFCDLTIETDLSRFIEKEMPEHISLSNNMNRVFDLRTDKDGVDFTKSRDQFINEKNKSDYFEIKSLFSVIKRQENSLGGAVHQIMSPAISLPLKHDGYFAGEYAGVPPSSMHTAFFSHGVAIQTPLQEHQEAELKAAEAKKAKELEEKRMKELEASVFDLSIKETQPPLNLIV